MIGNIIVFRPNVGSIVVPAGEPIELNPGDALNVSVSFSYRVNTAGSCYIVGYIGSKSSPTVKGTQEVLLSPVEDFTTKDASVNIAIPSAGLLGGGVPGGTYNLGVYIQGTDLFQEIPDCVTIVASGGISDMIGMMMMMMMLGMIMPMMTDIGD